MNLVAARQTNWLASALCFACWMLFISAGEIFVPSSSILSVSLNSREVEVNRTFDVNDVGAGYHTLVLSHLPIRIDESSISVEGRGPADLLSTTRVKRTFQRFDNPEYIKLKQQLETLRESLVGKMSSLNREAKMKQDRVVAMKKFVDSRLQAKDSTGSTAATELPLEKVVEILDAQDREIAAADAKIGTLEKVIKTYEDAVNALDTTLKALEQKGQYKPLINMLPAAIAAEYSQQLLQLPDEASTWSTAKSERDLHINIYVDSTALPKGSTKTKLTFFISYRPQLHSSWSADYDVKIDKTVSTSAATTTATAKHSFDLKIAFFATVNQMTGEDWEDVELQLSTADPSDVGYSPLPRREKISFYKPRPVFAHSRTAATSFSATSAGGRSKSSMKKRDFNMDGAEDAEFMSMESPEIEVDTVSLADESRDALIVDVPMHSKSSDLGATYVFSPKHKVTVLSDTRDVNGYSTASSSTRLFISEMSLNPLIYSYIVPTKTAERAFLKSWGQFSSGSSSSSNAAAGVNGIIVATDETALAPLLHSDEARIFLQGSYAGTTEVPSTQPGATLRLNLGEDKKLTFKSVFVPPRENSKEEESGKTQWFVTAEKEKFRVKHTEYAFSLLNTHESDHLVIMSEYLPHAVEDAIRVELVQPNPAQAIHLKRDNADSSGSSESSSDVWSEEEFVDAVLAHPLLLQHPMHPLHSLHEDKKATHIRATKQQQEEEERMKSMIGGEENLNRQFVFVSKGSSNVVWAQWVKPGQSVISSLQYRVIWPDGKEISSSSSN